jgi:hypothetical protein
MAMSGLDPHMFSGLVLIWLWFGMVLSEHKNLCDKHGS